MNDLPELNEEVQSEPQIAETQEDVYTDEAQKNSVDTEESIEMDGQAQEALHESNESTSESGEAKKHSSQPKQGKSQNSETQNSGDKNFKQRYEAFLEGLNAIEGHEEKLLYVVDFMETTLSGHQTTPHFKSFWDARAIALTLFKENITPSERVKLWDRYTALSKESRRLKLQFDEQGAFASEQIEIAVGALEKELENPEEALAKMQEANFLDNCSTLLPKQESYYQIQRRLNLLNAQAGRITALRKELIHTEMRVRQKNKFFQRLSAAGDKVFPQRKELINQLSQQFSEDIQTFIGRHFAQEVPHDSPFFLREEIKALQGVAKELTLNTQAFTRTRMSLSECWDKLKNFEKERKKNS